MIRRRTRHIAHRRAGGFTLVEMIAALSIVGLISSASSMLIYNSVRSYRDASARAALHSEASTALDRAFRLLSSISRDEEAGPIVQTIFVRRCPSVTPPR